MQLPQSIRDTPFPYALTCVVGFALAAWLMPTHRLPWASFHAEIAMSLAGLVGAIWVVWRGLIREAVLPALSVVTLLAAVVPLAQLAGGVIVFRGDAALASLYLLGFALAQIIGAQAAEVWSRTRVFETLAWLIMTAALGSVWLALYQWQQLDYLGLYTAELPRGARPVANLNQPNLLATLLVLGLLATACLHSLRKFSSVVAIALVALMAFGLALAQSRAGWLEVVLVGALLLHKRKALVSPRHVLAGGMLVVVISIGWQAGSHLAEQPAVRSNPEIVQAGARLIHWQSMADAISRRPWSGYGWNGTVIAQFDVAPDHPATREVITYSHNIVLDLLVWNGLPLGVALLVALAWWFRAAIRAADGASAVIAIASVVAVFTHAMVEFPLYYALFLLPVGVWMGAASPVGMRGAMHDKSHCLTPSLLAVAGIALAIVVSDYLGLERDVQSLRFERARIGVDQPPHELSNPLLLTDIAAFARFARTPEREGMSGAELTSMNEVVQRFPSAANMVRYAAALTMNGRPVDASRTLLRVCKIQSAQTCAESKRLWAALGERRPVLTRLNWPQE